MEGNLCVLFFFFFLKDSSKFEYDLKLEFITWLILLLRFIFTVLNLNYYFFFFLSFSCKFLSRVRSSTKKFQRTCVHSEDKHRLFEARGTSVELVIKWNNEELWLKQISETLEIKWSNSSIQLLCIVNFQLWAQEDSYLEWIEGLKRRDIFPFRIKARFTSASWIERNERMQIAVSCGVSFRRRSPA